MLKVADKEVWDLGDTTVMLMTLPLGLDWNYKPWSLMHWYQSVPEGTCPMPGQAPSPLCVCVTIPDPVPTSQPIMNGFL